MSTAKLDEAVRAHYREATLPPETLERWVASRESFARNRFIFLGTAAAAVGIALMLLLPQMPSGLERRLAAEVWAHAEHPKPPAVFASTLEALGPKLARIDFRLRSSSRLAGLHTLGGRPCSLDGQVAAQVTLEDGEGRRHILYITPATARFQGLEEVQVEVQGGHVHLWREHGLVYALASSRETPTS